MDGARSGVHNSLDIAGMIPGIGEAADLANAALYWHEGDYLNATLSASSAVPVVGNFVTGGKWAKRGAKAIDAAGGVAKHGDEVCDGINTFCFTAGTQVVVGTEFTEDDVFVQYVTKNIEDIEVGDLVYSYNTVTGVVEQAEVTETFVLQSDHVNYLTILDENGEEQIIETTNAHPFFVVTDNPDPDRAASSVVDENGQLLYHENIGETENGYWVEAKNLQPGDQFLDANGHLSQLIGIERVEFSDGIAVYNFTVANNSNYFVIAEGEFGQTCVLVHNAGCHGNSKNSPKPATLYRRVDKDGNHQKWGISQNPDTRYTKPQLGTDHLEIIETGPRDEILAKERALVESDPGPMNREPWAGKATKITPTKRR